MININTTVVIIPSEELSRYRLEALSGREEVVTEELLYSGRKTKGYMIRLNEAYMDEFTWFIPAQSVKKI